MMSPTTPTMVSQGDLESGPPSRMCLPTGDSFFHQRSAMRWLITRDLGCVGSVGFGQQAAGHQRNVHQIEIVRRGHLVHAVGELVRVRRAGLRW